RPDRRGGRRRRPRAGRPGRLPRDRPRRRLGPARHPRARGGARRRGREL
ncbi:MAG: hypothetical protein AVDCRST_MAG52-938, partial [uncultured Blastococcus sp.]